MTRTNTCIPTTSAIPLASPTAHPPSPHPQLTPPHPQVTIDGALTDFPTLCCHCTSCKRRSGGLASYAVCVPRAKAHISGASHKAFVDRDTGSGHPMQRTMCATCGSPVAVVEHGDPDTTCLQYGLFGDRELPKPKLEMFWSEAERWEEKVGEDVRETV